MPGFPLHLLLRQLRRRISSEHAGVLTDVQLLDRFVRQRDEAAFEVLVWRHGPAVLGVCRRLLGRSSDVEDAFQGTFLALVRKAATIRNREAVGSWLYKVAYRVALRLRAAAGRRDSREEPGVELVAAEADSTWRDLRPVLDEEVNRLPARYRGAFVLCYLQGRTNEEAARELGCPVGTVASRLAWARERLRQRLTHRGVAVSAALLAAATARNASAAMVPVPLALSTVRAATFYGAGQTAGVVSLRAVSLAEGVLKTMYHTKLKMAAAVLLTLGMLGAGAGILGQGAKAKSAADEQVVQDEPPARDIKGDTPKKPTPKDQPKADPTRTKFGAEVARQRNQVEIPSQRDGIVLVVGAEIKPDEREPGDQIVTVAVGGQAKQFRRLRVGDKVKPGQLLARIEDDLARDDVAIKQAKLESAEAELVAASKTADEAGQRYKRMMDLRGSGTVANEEVMATKLTMERYQQEAASKAARVRVAKLELKQAETVLRMYEIRSRSGGTVKQIYKHPGEAVKALEAVVQIQLDERE